MANESITLFNFYHRYRWNHIDFTTLQDSLYENLRGFAEGVYKGSVLTGFATYAFGIYGEDNEIWVDGGIAVSRNGNLLVAKMPQNLTIEAPTTHPVRCLVVARAKTESTNYITEPTDPMSSVPLNSVRSMELVVLRGAEAASPDYPSPDYQTDVVLAGVRIAPGQTKFELVDFDYEQRDVPGRQSDVYAQNISKADTRLRPYKFGNLVTIQKSQIENPRAFSYIVGNRPSVFPKTSLGGYSGVDCWVYMETGAIGGGDEVSPDFTPVIPTSGNAVVACIGINANDEVEVAYGSEGTRQECLDGIINQAPAGPGSISIPSNTKPICFVICYSSNGTNINEIDVIDCRSEATISTSAGPTFVEFTTDQNWTVPAGVTKLKVKAFSTAEEAQSNLGSNIKLDTSRKPWSWGHNINFGAIGDGTTVHKSSPVAVAGNLRFKMVSYACGVTADGKCYAWGANNQGQIGDGTSVPKSSPVLVVGGLKFEQVVCRGESNIKTGLTTDGDVYCWGVNSQGELGDGTTTSKSSPTLVLGGLKFKQVGEACGITLDGSTFVWGLGFDGGNGDGTQTDHSSPVQVIGGLKFKKICQVGGAGRAYLAVTEDGTPYAWGRNSYGQLGDGTTAHKSSPVLVLGGLKFVAIAGGGGVAAGLTANGTLYTWGNNFEGALGIGTSGSGTYQSSPVAVIGGLKFSSITATEDSGPALFALTRDTGLLYAWGINNRGQLGDGTSTDRSSPVLVVGGLNFLGNPTATPAGEVLVDVTPGEQIHVSVSGGFAMFGGRCLSTRTTDKIVVEY